MRLTLFLFAFLLCAFNSFSARLSINWTFTHVNEGYDHDNRIEVYLDGKYFTTSEIYKQSAVGTLAITIPSGSHALKLVDFAFYEGKWEEHTVANEYSVDAVVEQELHLKKNAVLSIVFDIENESVSVDLKTGNQKTKEKKSNNAKSAKFTVSWEYANLVEGYDHESRMVIYVDGKRKFESATSLESEGGTLTFNLPKGKHNLRFQTEVHYKGVWEEQLKVNQYSIDAFFELDGYQSKNSLLKLKFDIGDESTSYNLSN